MIVNDTDFRDTIKRGSEYLATRSQFHPMYFHLFPTELSFSIQGIPSLSHPQLPSTLALAVFSWVTRKNCKLWQFRMLSLKPRCYTFFRSGFSTPQSSWDLSCLSYPTLWILYLRTEVLPGIAFIGPHITSSNSLSIISIGGRGSLNTQRGRAKLTVMFL